MRARSSACGRVAVISLSSYPDDLLQSNGHKTMEYATLVVVLSRGGGIRSMFHLTSTFPTAALIALLWCIPSVLQQHTRLSSRVGIVHWSNSVLCTTTRDVSVVSFICEKASVI